MDLSKYQEVYNLILEIAEDADGWINLNPDKETLEKAKIVNEMFLCLEDVPKHKYDFYKHLKLIKE